MGEQLSDGHNVDVRPMTEDDLDQHMAQWLQSPPVAERFLCGVDAEALIEKYRARIRGEGYVRMFCMVLDSEPAGMMQAYWLRDDPDYQHLAIASQQATGRGLPIDDDAVAIDYFIGNRGSFSGPGLGTAMIRAMAYETVPAYFPGAKQIVADPTTDNPASIGALKNAGFIGAENENKVLITTPDDKNPNVMHEAQLMVLPLAG